MINKIVEHVGKHAWKYGAAAIGLKLGQIWGKKQKAKGRAQGVAEQAKRDQVKFDDLKQKHNKDRAEAKRIINEQDEIIKDCLK